MEKQETKKTISIHGKEYMPVNQRVLDAHADLERLSITTEVLFQAPVVVKATVLTEKGTFTGISAANPTKTIEKQSPYEVAETSAVGRALGFAGYGIVEGIASADELVRVNREESVQSAHEDIPDLSPNESYTASVAFTKPYCPNCMKEAVTSKRTGKLYCPNFLKHPKDGTETPYIELVYPGKKEKPVQLDEEVPPPDEAPF